MRSGAIYGVTAQGGNDSFGYGVVYRLSPPRRGQTEWRETVLHKFKGGRDGATPQAGVTFGPDGALYGTTNFGGGCKSASVGCGTVYRLKPPKRGRTTWTEEVLYRFKGGVEGQFPTTDVVVARNGGVIGTTKYGGKFGTGVVFALNPHARAPQAGPPLGLDDDSPVEYKVIRSSDGEEFLEAVSQEEEDKRYILFLVGKLYYEDAGVSRRSMLLMLAKVLYGPLLGGFGDIKALREWDLRGVREIPPRTATAAGSSLPPRGPASRTLVPSIPIAESG